MRISLIIPAAGLGSRFQQSLDRASRTVVPGRSKLLYELNGEPVLIKTLRAFEKVPGIHETVIAVSPEMRSEVRNWKRLIRQPNIRWIPGGKTRSESVWNALQKTSPESDWIMVHDGARPLVTHQAVQRVVKAAKGWDGVILARKVVPTIKKVLTGDGHICETVDRNSLYEAETPQLVRRDALLAAYRQNPKSFEATDEAGLLEAIGARVRVVAHDDWNPKVTTLMDLTLAKSMLEKNVSEEIRVGIGFDTHRLVKGRKLWLGGIRVPSLKGSLGHSDGDALLHAIADAVLGVIGAGDIGEWFSDRDRRWKNMKSSIIVDAVLTEAKKKGWTPYHVDSNIILETPKLGPYKMKIKKTVAKLLGIPVKDVSIKARTREGLGPEGEGLAVTCEAVISMRKMSA